MAKISNTLSYPNQTPIEGADYLIGTAANSTPIDSRQKHLQYKVLLIILLMRHLMVYHTDCQFLLHQVQAKNQFY